MKGMVINMLMLLTSMEKGENKNKLEALYIKYKKDMFYVAYNILKDEYLAQDAVQLAFINLINNLDKIDEIKCNKTKAFAVIIVRNISINLYRKKKKQKDIALEFVEGTLFENNVSIDEKLIHEEMLNRVASMIKELPLAYSDVLSLKYFYDYSDKEIAKLLDITPENARIRLYRAKQKLMKLLLQEEELMNQ